MIHFRLSFLIFSVVMSFGWCCAVHTQEPVSLYHEPGDSTLFLQEVQVNGFAGMPFRWLTPASVGLLQTEDIQQQSVTSLVPAMNTITGVRMEERSPGSYRLSIRGSLVRSPYGVRNVKIYYNGYSLTDAGGNTYLNILNSNDLTGVEVIKGPDGSMYGANSGGVVFLGSDPAQIPSLQVSGYGGSKGLAGEYVHLTRQDGNHHWSLKQSSQRADGYRRNSRHHRFFIQLSDRWEYRPGRQLEGDLFYADLAYRTPGGLTLEQYEADPKQSRPATAILPGSEEQKTRISTRMVFGGIRHIACWFPWMNHTFSFWGNHVDFIYPFITNYEIRNETNLGARTSFLLEEKRQSNWHPSLEIGGELQRLRTDAWNYDNYAGVKGDVQAWNDIVNTQAFVFLKGKLVWLDRLTFEASVSLNFNGYHFRDTTNIRDNFVPVWMPHLGVNYRLSETIGLRFSLSKGYSTPTTAEVRPSDNKIYAGLQPEKGWNVEGGLRFRLPDGRFSLDGSCFHYLLQDGIVSQSDSTGNTWFVNSGQIKQLGVEGALSWQILPLMPQREMLRQLRWRSSYTYSHFYYDRYLMNQVDYSGNRVAGVPRTIWVNSLDIGLSVNLDLFVQHSYTSRISLNDANDAWADGYHLLSARLDLRLPEKDFLPSRLYLAGDNLLNQTYSLGNDINAVGKRYYNAAAAIHFVVGMVWQL